MRMLAIFLGMALGGLMVPAVNAASLNDCALDVTRTRNAEEMTCYTTIGPRQVDYKPNVASKRDPLDQCLSDAWYKFLAGRNACDEAHGVPPQPRRPGIWEFYNSFRTRQ
jgi:hypothetical protein